MSEQGYVTMAVDSEYSSSQIQSAYALACSLRLADSEREIALVTDKFSNVPKKYEDAFDYIIELPYGASGEGESDLNLWQLYYCTPFDETVYVNPASLAVDNIESFWDTAIYDSLVFPSQTLNFKLEPSQYWEGRSVFQKNSLPSIHSDVFYFKRNDKAGDFFKMADVVFKNWRHLFFEYIKEERPETFRADIAFALTGYMMGESLQPVVDQLHYTDLSPYNLPELDEAQLAEWQELISLWFYQGNKVKVNNHRQTGFFVYHDTDFLTKETIDDLRKYCTAATHN